MSGREPLVSVVTPVYNGAKYLTDCIESVIAQTHSNWIYTILDNHSTDGTAEIAETYAAQEARIRVRRTDNFLSAVENHNLALGLIRSESHYCKIVHADDSLLPHCVQRMVALAERHPTVKIVASRRRYGRVIVGKGLPTNQSVFSGRMVGRDTFRRRYSLFGSPTTVLYRTELFRNDAFFSSDFQHWDKAACFSVLHDCDFGFLSEVLTSTRLHDESLTSRIGGSFQTSSIDELLIFRRYGRLYFDCKEFEALLKTKESEYYRSLARFMIGCRGARLVNYHRTALRRHGVNLGVTRLLAAIVAEVITHIKNPPLLAERLKRRGKSILESS